MLRHLLLYSAGNQVNSPPSLPLLLETLLNTGEAERERCFSSLPQLSLIPPSSEIKLMYARFRQLVRRRERLGRDKGEISFISPSLEP